MRSRCFTGCFNTVQSPDQTVQAPAVLSSPDQALLARVRGIIDGFPHRDAIRSSDYRSWTVEIVRQFGELSLWHAARSGGFGGSQIGALVRNHNGHFADFGGSARDIVNLCLLRAYPEEPKPAMLRGVENEELHAPKFYKKWNVVRDLPAYNALKSGVGQFPWMRYSPDDVVCTPNGVRWLIDYKAPTTVEPSAEVSFQYVCQLHQGRLVCENGGVRIDGMLLSQFDWANWGLKDDVVPYVPELDQMIIEAGNHYWNNHVMKGVAPDYVRKTVLDNVDELKESLTDLANSYAQMAALSTAMEKLKDKLSTDFKAKLAALRFGQAKLPFEFSSVAAVQQIDVEKVTKALGVQRVEALSRPGEKFFDPKLMQAHLKTSGVDMAQFVSPSAALDAGAVYEALIAAGHDPETMMREQLRITVNRELQKQAVEWVDAQIVRPNPTFTRLVHEKAALDPADSAAEGIDRLGDSSEPGTQRSSMNPGSV